MDEFEDLVNRYRPIGPPAELRERIVHAADRHVAPRRLSRFVEWLPAATVLALAVLFRWLATNQEQRMDAHFTPVPPIYQTVSEIEDAPR
jgi:hypothetical protein